MKVIGDGIGELKRMWVAPAARGLGIALRLLDALEHQATGLHLHTVRLDTNRSLAEARALYARNGYREIGRYNDNRMRITGSRSGCGNGSRILQAERLPDAPFLAWARTPMSFRRTSFAPHEPALGLRMPSGFPFRADEMHSGLADFIEHHAETIIEHAIVFAKSVDVGTPLDDTTLRDHLPEIVAVIVADLRTPQTRSEEVEKSEGRALAPAGQPRSAAATHALHRAHSGYSISHLVSEYRALRASVLRLWTDAPDREFASPKEVTRFNEAIDEAIAESVSHYADEMERWRSIFLGVLGHDLRSPLSAIVMTSQLIAHMAVDAPIATAAQRLIRSGKSMGELLDKLLVYNRTQMGLGFEVEKEDVDLAHACREEIEQLRASMPEARIHFQSPESLRGMFDAGRIREALANLVVNADKYGTRGGEIRVELRDEDTSAELAVSNDGDPIPRETLDLMFEPLRRGGVSGGESEQASLGLGLFVVSQIAQAHAGTVRAESAKGKTTFTVHLPRT